MSGHFRSRPRVTARVVLRAVQRRPDRVLMGEFSGAFQVASARHSVCRLPRRSASSDRAPTGRVSRCISVAPRIHGVWRRSRRPVSSDRALMGRVSRRIQWAQTVRLRWMRSFLDRRLVVREDRRDTMSSTCRRTVALSSSERTDETGFRARLSTICRASRRPREDRRFTLSSTIDELSCSCRPRESTRDTLSSSLSMNCRALGVGEDTRHDIEHDLDDLSCTRRPRGSTRHWRATCLPDRKRPSAAVTGTVYPRRCFHFVWPGF